MASLKDKIKNLLKRSGKKSKANQPTATENTAAPAAPAAPAAAATPAAAPAPAAAAATTTTTSAVPSTPAAPKIDAVANTSGTLQIVLQNFSNSSNVYAYITGQAIANNNALFLLQSDARTPYYPPSPSGTGAPIGANISIPLGSPGNTVTATIPYLAGARLWFCEGDELTFLLNPGPGLVEPSVFNQSDPNINKNFSFCEFTFNSSQLFANISYVDFVSNAPIALTLKDTTGGAQHVSGMHANGLQTVCNGLQAQSAKDGHEWRNLIVERNGQPLRALSPNSGITLNGSWFQTYWEEYVNKVWAKYANTPLTVDTQASFGNVQARINSAGLLDFGNGATFARPSARDIFSNSTGPFATGANTEINAIIPRLAAAFNRSGLLGASDTPDAVKPLQYYTNSTTNHYARIVHAANLDGMGYAFPYDDVTPTGGVPQEGAVQSGNPASLIASVGGNNAFVLK